MKQNSKVFFEFNTTVQPLKNYNIQNGGAINTLKLQNEAHIITDRGGTHIFTSTVAVVVIKNVPEMVLMLPFAM